MSPDLRSALKQAAPEPRAPLDTSAIAKRARRQTWTHIVAAVASAVVLAGGAAWVATLLRDAAPPEIGTHRDDRMNPDIPDGRRYPVMSGRYGDDWAFEPGKDWTLLVWGDEHTECWQIATQDTEPHEGVACSEAPTSKRLRDDDSYFTGSTSFYTQSSDPDQWYFVIGGVEQNVASLRFTPDDRDPIDIPLHDPPPESGVDVRFYSASLPEFDVGVMEALDASGEILDSDTFCGPGCQDEKDLEREEAAALYESRPISERSRAAVFALAALSQADLLNPFGTRYGYEDISEDGRGEYVATFKVSDCSDALEPSGNYQCTGPRTDGWIRVVTEGDRFVVDELHGPATERQRRSLMSYSEPIPDDPPRWRYLTTYLAETRDKDHSFGVVIVWTGDLPPPTDGYGSFCRELAYDEKGSVIHEGRPWPAEVRDGEYFRVSGVGSEFSADIGKPAEVEVVCEDPSANFTAREP